MKKIILVILAVLVVISLVACTQKAEENAQIVVENPNEEQINVSIENDKSTDMVALIEKLVKEILDVNISDEMLSQLQTEGVSNETLDLLRYIGLPNEDEALYNDGVYTGVADAHNGPITVEVTVADGKIVYIVVIDHSETAPMLPEVFNSIPLYIPILLMSQPPYSCIVPLVPLPLQIRTPLCA